MTIAHIFNGELGFDVRTKLNALIDLAGGGIAPFTQGSVLFADISGNLAQDNANFFWDDATNLLTSGVGLKIKGTTSGTVTLNAKAVAGTWTLTLPDSAGTSGYVLSTDGAGITSWMAAGGGGGMAIGGAITGATAGRVLFAGTGGILDDDSTFTWNDTLKDLAIGGAYYVNAARALYVVPHVSGNNWFEGSAGNQTVTGYNNFGTGDNSLNAVTSGYDNVALGSDALRFMTSGYRNFALGSNSLRLTLTDNNNVAVGSGALQALGSAGAGGGSNSGNVAIGYGAINQAFQAYGNIAVGYIAMGNIVDPTVATFNIAIGSGAGGGLGTGGGSSVDYNVMIGTNAGLNLTGASKYNTMIGGWRGPSATVNNGIALSDGINNYALLDFYFTSAYVWSFNMCKNTVPAMIHIYNHQSPAYSTTNYDRTIMGFDDYAGWADKFRIGSEAGGTGVKRIIMIDGFAKAGAPANTDLLAGCFAVIDDTSAGQTWLVFNKAGTIRKVQLT